MREWALMSFPSHLRVMSPCSLLLAILARKSDAAQFILSESFLLFILERKAFKPRIILIEQKCLEDSFTIHSQVTLSELVRGVSLTIAICKPDKTLLGSGHAGSAPGAIRQNAVSISTMCKKHRFRSRKADSPTGRGQLKKVPCVITHHNLDFYVSVISIY